jgi:hypothetical protein
VRLVQKKAFDAVKLADKRPATNDAHIISDIDLPNEMGSQRYEGWTSARKRSAIARMSKVFSAKARAFAPSRARMASSAINVSSLAMKAVFSPGATTKPASARVMVRVARFSAGMAETIGRPAHRPLRTFEGAEKMPASVSIRAVRISAADSDSESRS